MIEVGYRAGFGEILLGIFGFRDPPGVWHLDGHGPVQLLILSQINQAEAPFSQDLLDPVSTNPLQVLSGSTSSLRDGVPMAIQREIVGI
jgi:hypothetical protein